MSLASVPLEPERLEALRRGLSVDLALEARIRERRTALLQAVARDPRASIERLDELTAIAEQAFTNDYVWSETRDERVLVGALTMPSDGDVSTSLVVLFAAAMYRRPASLPYAERLLQVRPSEVPAMCDRAIRRLILEPIEERRLAAALPSFGRYAGGTPPADAVRDQYEALPYPPVFGFRHPPPEQIEDARTGRILLAGCGVAQPLEVAARLPQCEVVAVDISRASLARAQRRARAHEVGNLAFMHGDLADVAELGPDFDLVKCTGVLHHLEDPDTALRSIVSVMKPGADLHLSVYSRVARMHVTFIRDEIAKRVIPAEPDAMRAFRDELLTATRFDKIRPSFLVGDMFTLGGFRDYLFHARESAYTLDDIAQMLDRHHLKFTEFDALGLADDYRSDFPGDLMMQSFAHWRAFEPRYAGSNLMFSFWARKR